ncbi:MAG: cytochrome C oxidase subunit IV family protein [Thermoanaerobaculia bacterium]|nr:cytochrome C oxidase subunit IV family protein [Thermoanaerobaculia bacterium]MCZ7651774.1 cytochrome C oxidase subunit IV family protein [Thermoanaerobaculia bacterium]
MSNHIVPVRVYLLVFGALMVLTTVTVVVAYFDFGVLNNVIMLGIAAVKATLVVLYFMHVRYGTQLIPIVVGSSVLWLLILLAFTLADYFTRGWMGAGSSWL